MYARFFDCSSHFHDWDYMRGCLKSSWIIVFPFENKQKYSSSSSRWPRQDHCPAWKLLRSHLGTWSWCLKGSSYMFLTEKGTSNKGSQPMDPKLRAASWGWPSENGPEIWVRGKYSLRKVVSWTPSSPIPMEYRYRRPPHRWEAVSWTVIWVLLKRNQSTVPWRPLKKAAT